MANLNFLGESSETDKKEVFISKETTKPTEKASDVEKDAKKPTGA